MQASKQESESPFLSFSHIHPHRYIILYNIPSLSMHHLCLIEHPRYTPVRQGMLNPYPAIQLRYLLTRSLHASCGSAAVEKSMHSSRADFSSLQTQQGWQPTNQYLLDVV